MIKGRNFRRLFLNYMGTFEILTAQDHKLTWTLGERVSQKGIIHENSF